MTGSWRAAIVFAGVHVPHTFARGANRVTDRLLLERFTSSDHKFAAGRADFGVPETRYEPLQTIGGEDLADICKKQQVAPGLGHAGIECECLTPEGFLVKLGYTISPLSSESGETTGLVITFQDLTDVRAMEGDKKARAAKVGELVAARAREAGVTAVVFDRGGYVYHGRVAALADAAREGGLEF